MGIFWIINWVLIFFEKFLCRLLTAVVVHVFRDFAVGSHEIDKTSCLQPLTWDPRARYPPWSKPQDGVFWLPVFFTAWRGKYQLKLIFEIRLRKFQHRNHLFFFDFSGFGIIWNQIINDEKIVKMHGEFNFYNINVNKQCILTNFSRNWFFSKTTFSYYFVFRYNANKASEDAIRAYEAKMKPIWDAEKAAKAAKENREGMIKLAREVGVKVPANF